MVDPSKTEKATPRRRSELRDKGQVAKSQEFNTAVLFVLALVLLRVYIPRINLFLQSNTQELWSSFPRELTVSGFMDVMWKMALGMFTALAPLILLLVIGAVLVPGAAAPKLLSRAQLSELKPGAVLVDVAIDQGGCFETSRATTHEDPIYDVDGIMHYCVANMPGAVARTSTIALGNATMPFVIALADKGWRDACAEDEHLLAGLNVHAGKLTYHAVGKALGIDVLSPRLALKT